MKTAQEIQNRFDNYALNEEELNTVKAFEESACFEMLATHDVTDVVSFIYCVEFNIQHSHDCADETERSVMNKLRLIPEYEQASS